MRWLFAAVLIVATACGARSTLDLEVDPLGVGPAGQGGSGASGGGGGSGGDGGDGGDGGSGGVPSGFCELDGPVATVAGTGAFNLQRPVLTFSTNSEQLVTLLTSWQMGTLGAPQELRHTSFQPWSSWPSDGMLGPSYLANLDGGVSFGAHRSTPGFFEVSFIDGTNPNNPKGLWVELDHLANQANNIMFTDVLDPDALEIIGHTRGLVAYRRQGSGGSQHHNVYIVQPYRSDHGFGWYGPERLGCSQGAPPLVAAVTLEGQYVVAVNQASGVLDGSCGSSGVGPPSELWFVRFTNTGQVKIGDSRSTGQLDHLAAAPIGVVGAWIAFRRPGDAPIEVMRVDEEGNEQSEPVAFTDELAGARFDLDRLGSWPTLAYITDTPGGPELVVSVHSGEGELIATGSLGGIGGTRENISLLGSPAGDQLVVAWEEIADDGTEARVARFRCVIDG